MKIIDELNEVLSNDLCSGCGACAAINNNVEVKIDDDGYSRPIISSDSSKNGESDRNISLKEYCPGLAVPMEDGFPDRDSVWGNIVGIYNGYSVDESLRFSGSSGGVISAICNYALTSGYADFVINVSASDNSIDNETKIRESGFDFCESAGSRYSPASPASQLRHVIENNGKYVFVGKPCDVAALKNLQGVIPELRERVVLSISFMCAGTPSMKSTDEIIEKLGGERNKTVSFKYRGGGWPGLTEAKFDSGITNSMEYSESWGRILNKTLQHRCKVCADGIGELADIVCADSWECDEKGYPLFAEKNGMSMVIARTNKGKQFVDLSRMNGKIELLDFDITSLPKIQPFQYYRRTSMFARILALKVLGYKAPRYKGFSLVKVAFKAGIVMNIKAFWGMVVRKNRIKVRKVKINGR